LLLTGSFFKRVDKKPTFLRKKTLQNTCFL
jgi:hypothetical protein